MTTTASEKEVFKSKYIVWTYSDYGWHPAGYETLKDAISHDSYGSTKYITRGAIDFDVSEKALNAE